MALFKIKTTTNAIMVINSANIIAVVDETAVEGYKEELGQSNIFLFGGLSVRSDIPASKLEKLLEKTESLIDLTLKEEPHDKPATQEA